MLRSREKILILTTPTFLKVKGWMHIITVFIHIKTLAAIQPTICSVERIMRW